VGHLSANTPEQLRSERLVLALHAESFSGLVLHHGMQSTQHHKMPDPWRRKSDCLPLSHGPKLDHTRV
jgi:hypothetical protein